MKILLLGAGGQLGRTLLEHAPLAALGHIIPVTRNGRLEQGGMAEVGDLTDENSLLDVLNRVQPQVIINAAAYTAVDKAESEESVANRVNGRAPGELGRWAARNGGLVIHYSTDYVFDGTAITPYAVQAPTAPLGAYGRSKLLGERELVESGAHAMVIRTSWVYAAHGHNFLRTMLRLARERPELRVVADQTGSPTSTEIIASGTTRALLLWQASTPDERSRLEGIHHLTASGITTWHGFAQAIVTRAARSGLLSRTPKVLAITSAEFPTPAQRPSYSVLDTTEFQRMFSITLPSWEAALDQVFANLPHDRK